MCPREKDYGRQYQEKLADELEHLPPEFTAIPPAMIDYGKLRAEARACRGQ